MPSAVTLRDDYSAEAFGRWPDARRTSTRAGGFCRWLRFGTGWTGARRRRSGAWTGRRCATGSIASTPRVRMGSSTTGPTAPSPACRKSSWLSSPGSLRPVRIWERDGVVRWRRIDLKRVIAERFGVDFHPRYVGRLLHKLGFSHISARPRHPAQDERIVAAFKKISRAR